MSAGRNAAMIVCLVAALVPAIWCAAEPVTLENDWLTVVISPEEGGRITALTDRRIGRSWTSALPGTVAPSGSGLLLDRFWGDRQVRDLETSPYQLAEATADSVRLVRVHKVGDREGFVVEKTISLPADRACVVADYSVANVSTGDWQGRFWVAGLPRPGLEATEPLVFHFPMSWHRAEYRARPGMPGRWRFDYHPDQETSQNIWISRPTAGWAAVTCPDGAGLVMTVDGAYVEDLYSHMPVGTATGGQMATLEVMYGSLLLRPTDDDASRDALGIPPLVGMPDPGQPWRTRIELTPVTDLGETVLGAANGLIVGATLAEDEVALVVSADRALRLDGELTVSAIPDGEPVALGELDLDLQPDEVARLSLALPDEVQGSMVFELRGSLDGDTDLSMFLPVFADPRDARDYSEEPQFEPASDFKPEVRFPDLPPGAVAEHVPWAKPLRRAPRLLMLVPDKAVWGYYELAQRFDAQVDVVPVSHPHYFVYGRDPMGVDPNRLLPHLLAQPHDAIVLPAGVCWGTLPDECREQIVTQVEQGTGLLYVGPTLGDHFFPDLTGAQKEPMTQCDELPGVAERLVRGVPREGIPAFAGYDDLAGLVHAGQYGAGRVVVYDIPIWPNRRPYLVRDLLIPAATVEDTVGVEFDFREYHHLLGGRLLAWAAGVEPPLAMDVAVAATREDGLSATLHLTNALARPLNATARVRWLNRLGDEIGSSERSVAVPPGDSDAAFEAVEPEALLPGIVLAQVILTDPEGHVLGSGAGATSLSVGPRLQAVALDQFAHRRGEDVAGAVAVQGATPAGATVAVRASDRHGRLLAETSVPAPEAGANEIQPVRFSLAPTGVVSVLHHVEAVLQSADGTVLDVGRAEFTVEPREAEDVTFQIWGPRYSPNDPAGELETRIIERVGFDYATASASVVGPDELRREALAMLRLGLRPITMNLMRIAVAAGSMEGVERDPCLSSPQFRSGMREHAGRYVEALRDLFPAAYYNGDENSLGSYSKAHDFCQAPDSLAKFRDFLAVKYGSVERLNEEWGADFAEWEDVRPFTLAQAREGGSWAPWVEHRTWMATELADILAFQRRVVRDVDPDGRLAVSGMGKPSIYNGFDWPRLMPHLDHMAGYARQSGDAYRSELFRSFARPGAVLGTWTGYEADLAFIRDAIWWQVLSGFFCPAYYCSDFLHTPGLTETEAAVDLAATFAEIRSGLGALVMGAERLEDPIAVHHSFASFVSLQVNAERGEPFSSGTYLEALDGWTQLLHELGCQVRFVDREQLAAGTVTGEDFRVLIMSLAQAVDDSEVEAALRFAEAGGTVIVDPMFARLHQSGREAERPELMQRLGLTGEWSDEPATRTVAVGEGRFVVLHARLWDYLQVRKELRGRPVRDEVREALVTGGIVPAVELDAGEDIGRAFWAGEVVRFDIGAGEVVALRRNTMTYGLKGAAEPPTNELTVRWPEALHTWDARSKQYLGRIAAWSGTIAPGELVLLARLPYRVQGLSARAPRTVARGEAARVRVSLEGVGDAPARHVMHFEVLRPDGSSAPEHARNARLERGYCRAEIPHALNDPSGRWQARVTEVITGRQATVAWTVE